MSDIIVEIILRILMLPVSLVLSTPIILIRGIFIKGAFIENIKKDYNKIIEWWGMIL